MPNIFKLKLQKAFNDEVRKSYSSSIFNAYKYAWENSLEFGRFSQQAYPILRYFYCEHLIQMSSERHKLSCSLRDNETKNHKHLCIKSESLSLTIHHLDKNRSVPRKANYRSVYRSLNDDLFDDLDNNNKIFSSEAYVYLLHQGWKTVDSIFFAFPSDYGRIIYSEPLEIQQESFVKEEETPNEVKDKIKIIVEEQIRKTGSK